LDYVTADVLEGLEDLKLICVCRGTPVNVDLIAATENKILVANTPGRNAIAVAELAIGLMISIARHMSAGEKAIREGKWDRSLYFRLSGLELSGRTIGLVGLGAVACEIAKRLQGWDMRILAYDPYVTDEAASKAGAELTDLETVMCESDFVSIHLPVTEETKGLVNAKLIGMMKPTAYFINTARTATIDEEAVLKALHEKRIAGGGFDVFGQEPLPEDSPFLELDNVVMTPHLAGATGGVITNHSRMAYEDIQGFLNGETPSRAVNPEARS
jgi:D-3-phosphoglycerate dehydrogenase / 2-oxoglutarate reductase